MAACGQVDKTLDFRSEDLGFDSQCWSCVGQPSHSILPLPTSSDGYLTVPGGTKNWKIVKNGISFRKSDEFFPGGDETLEESVPIPGV